MVRKGLPLNSSHRDSKKPAMIHSFTKMGTVFVLVAACAFLRLSFLRAVTLKCARTLSLIFWSARAARTSKQSFSNPPLSLPWEAVRSCTIC